MRLMRSRYLNQTVGLNEGILVGCAFSICLAINTPAAAEEQVSCRDGTTQNFASGPPFCLNHGGATGVAGASQDTAVASSSAPPAIPSSDQVSCRDGTTQNFASGPPFCLNHGGATGVAGGNEPPKVYSRSTSPEPATIQQKAKKPIPWGKIALGLLIVGVAVAAAQSGGGGGYSAPTDYDWRWDGFRNSYGTLEWACRGVQTGQFADAYHCAGQLKVDTTWPGY
jgi:hypothetical protein